MGNEVSKSFRPALPTSGSALFPNPSLPNPREEDSSTGAQGFVEGFGGLKEGEWMGGDWKPGENERRPSGGGENARVVSGD